MTASGYLTPNDENGAAICRAFSIPVDFLPAFMGALGELANEWNWEQSGDFTPDQCALICAQIIDAFTDCDALSETEIDTMTQIFPRRAEWRPEDMTILVGSAWVRTIDTTLPHNYYATRGAIAINDSSMVTQLLDAGVYSLILVGEIQGSLGIISVYVDNVLVGTIDQYQAARAVNQTFTLAGINIAQGGLHTIEFRMATKNAASSSYGTRLNACSMRVTGS